MVVQPAKELVATFASSKEHSNLQATFTWEVVASSSYKDGLWCTSAFRAELRSRCWVPLHSAAYTRLACGCLHYSLRNDQAARARLRWTRDSAGHECTAVAARDAVAEALHVTARNTEMVTAPQGAVYLAWQSC